MSSARTRRTLQACLLLALSACSDDGANSETSETDPTTSSTGDGDPGDGDPGDGDPGDGDPGDGDPGDGDPGDGDPGDGDPGDGDPGDPPPDSCEGIGASTLDGACIFFPNAAGSWTLAEAAAGIEVPYYVIVEQDIPDVVALPQDWGGCSMPGPSGLDLFELLSGNDQSYCICDVGLCPFMPPDPAIVLAGQTLGAFAWEGYNWIGPSDFGNPPGDPFPPGVYTLEVSAIGTVGGQDFAVSNSFELTLTP